MFRNTCIVLAIALAVPLFAQHRGGGGGSRGGGSSGGARSGGFSSGVRSGGFSGGAVRSGSYSHGGGTVVRGGFSGFRGGYSGGYRGGYGYIRSYPRYWGFSYGYYPGFYAGYGLGYGYYGGFYNPYYYDPYYYPGYSSYYSTPAYSYSAPSSPVVIVNGSQSDYGRGSYDSAPAPREYAQPAERTYQPTIYSIAMRDHRIVQAVAYWVKDGALHYVTREHEMREIPLGEVDRRFSEQINRDKGVDFRLPE